MANVKITELTALTSPETTDVLPIVDVDTDVTKKVSVGEIVGKISGDVTVGTDGTAAITGGVIVNADVNASAAIAGTKIDPDFGSQTVETTGVINAGSGTAAAPAVTVGTADNGLYSPGTDQVAISSNGTERVEFGTSEVVFNDGSANYDFRIEGDTNSSLFFVDASANAVGIGTTSPGSALEIDAAAATSPFIAKINTSERARIDSSGRLLIGTSSVVALNTGAAPRSPANQFATLSSSNTARYALSCIGYNPTNGVNGAILNLARNKASDLTNTLVANDDELGRIEFAGADGIGYPRGASIAAEVNGTPGPNDMPCRLVFSTTADGASNPTERMRIASDGFISFAGDTDTGIKYIGTNSYGLYTNGTERITLGATGNIGFSKTNPASTIDVLGSASFERDANTIMFINRTTDDGILILFRQDGNTEGSVSVSGSTVSYNGAHMSRWSQLPGGAEREEILRGTVLSNIDEMCAWGEEDNEQLNRMKISDVEGDPNVSGVFQAWDDDDDIYTDDFYCAMTGDFIIRIGAGVTIQRGDLLMSAGDGTAKPQDDDIIRSKTIAKVTSAHVTCTYDDGSYCVPCVLMAC